MATAKTNHLPSLALSVIRPTLAEARLITAKRASDPVYAATLVEELSTIEGKIATLEEEKHLGSEAAPELPRQQRGCREAEGEWNADWIRSKSGELHRRLRRIERSSDKW